jgi:ribosomal protein S18 acetylase RimI-like enzyme
VLETSRGLPSAALDAIADLERRVVSADGGRLKLEWGTLRSRPADRVNDMLWWDGGTLVGFAGIYAFGGATPEIAGMVDPAARRRGIGTALLAAARAELAAREILRSLLVVPRQSEGGHAIAQRQGGALDHSEHALVLDGDPVDGPSDPALAMRRATVADAAAVESILADAFEWTPPDLRAQLENNDGPERTLVIERDGTAVGTVRLTHDGDTGGVYGFAVAPAEQGKGIGRDALRRMCRLLREEGAARVGLEVAVENERALGLYTSIGFRPVTTEDYYALSTSG